MHSDNRSTFSAVNQVKIDIVSDIVCPWCYVGRRRLAAALAQLPELAAVITWQPFELFPQLPTAGRERHAHMAQVFGSAGRRDDVFAHVAAVAAGEGLALDFAGIPTSPNTFDLHRLLWRARARGQQDAVAEALFRAFFTEHRDLSQPATLSALLHPLGWDAAETARFLRSDEGRAEVLTARRRHQQMGVRSVPCYLFNDTHALSGAQPTEAFVHALRAAARPAPARGPARPATA